MRPLDQFKRRYVFRVTAAYAALAWLLVQLAETLFPLFGFGDTPTRILVIILAIGFVPVAVCAWLLPPKLETPSAGSEIPEETAALRPAPGRWLDRTIIAVLAAAVGYFAVDKFFLHTSVLSPEPWSGDKAASQAPRQAGIEAPEIALPETSIAVLAFDDLSESGDQAYLSDGIAEELLNLLTRVPGLRVISRSSSFSYRGRAVRLEQVARELNVTYVMEGSVRRAGDRIRVTAQLIDARTDTHLWSQTYERTLEDIFAIQDEIGSAVVQELKVTLAGALPAVEDTDPRAYALGLQARHLAQMGSLEGYSQSSALYHQALAIDSSYATAWIGLATNYSNEANKSLRPYDQGYSLARDAARQALAADPANAAALAHLGWIAMVYDNDLAQSAAYLERALALAPTSTAIIGNAASLLAVLGRSEEAVILDEYVVRRDPRNATAHANLAQGYLALGRWEEAVAGYETALRLSPDRIGAHYFIGTALLLTGHPDTALVEMDRESLEVLAIAGRAMVFHKLGKREESDAELARLIGGYEREAAYNIATVLAFRGEVGRAFEWLDKARAYGDPGLTDIVGDPLFDNLQTDSRWRSLLELIGKAPGQLDLIPFTVTTPGRVG